MMGGGGPQKRSLTHPPDLTTGNALTQSNALQYLSMQGPLIGIGGSIQKSEPAPCPMHKQGSVKATATVSRCTGSPWPVQCPVPGRPYAGTFVGGMSSAPSARSAASSTSNGSHSSSDGTDAISRSAPDGRSQAQTEGAVGGRGLQRRWSSWSTTAQYHIFCMTRRLI